MLEQNRYTCGLCGFLDVANEFGYCPMCSPLPEEVEPECYFLMRPDNRCRMDSEMCPYVLEKNYDDCSKLGRDHD